MYDHVHHYIIRSNYNIWYSRKAATDDMTTPHTHTHTVNLWVRGSVPGHGRGIWPRAFIPCAGWWGMERRGVQWTIYAK